MLKKIFFIVLLTLSTSTWSYEFRDITVYCPKFTSRLKLKKKHCMGKMCLYKVQSISKHGGTIKHSRNKMLLGIVPNKKRIRMHSIRDFIGRGEDLAYFCPKLPRALKGYINNNLRRYRRQKVEQVLIFPLSMIPLEYDHLKKLPKKCISLVEKKVQNWKMVYVKPKTICR